MRTQSSQQKSRNHVLTQLDSLKSKCSAEQQYNSASTIRKFERTMNRTNSAQIWQNKVQNLFEQVNHVSHEELPLYYLDFEEQAHQNHQQAREAVEVNRKRILEMDSKIGGKPQLKRLRQETANKIEKDMLRIKKPMRLKHLAFIR